MNLLSALRAGTPITGISREPHEVTDACRVYHCFSHDRDEPVPDQPTGILCPECFHYYPSPRRMVWEYRRHLVGSYLADLTGPRYPGVSRIRTIGHGLAGLLGLARITHKRIMFCTHCLHDF